MIAPQPIQPTPERIISHQWGVGSTHVLLTAVELELFSVIAAGKRNVSLIAEETGAWERGLRILLDALVGMNLLIKNGDAYGLTSDSEVFLVKSSPFYLGQLIKQGGYAIQMWSGLTKVIRAGKPCMSVDAQHFEKFLPALAKVLFPLSYWFAQTFCASLLPQVRREIREVLDVGAGSGAWSLSFAQLDRDVSVTAVDFPMVLKVTEEYAARHGVHSQYKFLAGNVRQLDLGTNKYDLIILGNICHSEGERNTKILLEKSYKALRRGGRLLLADVVPNNDRTGSLLALLFAVNMLLNTTEGDVFTFAQYNEWLQHAGFNSVTSANVGGDSPLILAQK